MALERTQIDSKYKWDLSAIYKSEADFLADYKLCEEKIKAFSKHERTVTESAEGLLATLRDMCEIDEKIEKLWNYAFLGFSLDTSDNFSQAQSARVRNLAVSAGSAMWFISPYILKLEDGTVEGWIEECPGLLTYRRMLMKTLRTKPSIISRTSSTSTKDISRSICVNSG